MAFDLTIFDDIQCAISNRCELDCNIDLDTVLSGAELGFPASEATINLLKLWDFDPVGIAAHIAPPEQCLEFCIECVQDIRPLVQEWWPSANSRVEEVISAAEMTRKRLVGLRFDTGPQSMAYFVSTARGQGPGLNFSSIMESSIAQAVLALNKATRQFYGFTGGRHAQPELLEHTAFKDIIRNCAFWCREVVKLAGDDVDETHCWQIERLLRLALGDQPEHRFAFAYRRPRPSPEQELGITSFTCEGRVSWR